MKCYILYLCYAKQKYEVDVNDHSDSCVKQNVVVTDSFCCSITSEGLCILTLA